MNGSVEISAVCIICFDVIRRTGNMLYFAVKKKNEFISDIAVLLLKIKSSTESCVTMSQCKGRGGRGGGQHCAAFPV